MPKTDPTISIFDWGKTKTTITVLELQKLFKEPDYEAFYTLTLKMIAEGKLVAITASGQNGRLPSLYNKYRIIRPLKDHTDCLEQIRCLEPSLNIAAYLQKTRAIYQASGSPRRTEPLSLVSGLHYSYSQCPVRNVRFRSGEKRSCSMNYCR